MINPGHKNIEPLITVYAIRAKQMAYLEANGIMATVATLDEADQIIEMLFYKFPEVDPNFFWRERLSVWSVGLAIENNKEFLTKK